MGASTFTCRTCGRKTQVGDIIGRRDTCDNCGADLRACVQCRHYDTSYADDCREHQAEPVPDKEKANFCDFYQPAQGGVKETGQAMSKSKAEEEWEKLFGKK